MMEIVIDYEKKSCENKPRTKYFNGTENNTRKRLKAQVIIEDNIREILLHFLLEKINKCYLLQLRRVKGNLNIKARRNHILNL